MDGAGTHLGEDPIVPSEGFSEKAEHFDHAGDDERVGYCRPPKHTRFQSKKSGNPSGRPKGRRGMKADLYAELAKKMTLTIGGKPKRYSIQRMVVALLVQKVVLKGDVRAREQLFSLIVRSGGLDDQFADRAKLSEADMQLLEQFLNTGPTSEPETDTGDGDASENDKSDPTQAWRAENDQEGSNRAPTASH